MRLFIAFNASKEVEQHAFELQKTLERLAKLTLPKSFHLTLKFLGEVTPQNAELVKERLKAIKFKPFTARLNGTGVFPGKKYVRVVWIGLEPGDKIVELQAEVEKALKGLFPVEKRFHPHITLARVKSVSDKNAFLQAVQQLPVKPIEFEVKEIILYESRLGRQGSEYTPLVVCPAQAL